MRRTLAASLILISFGGCDQPRVPALLPGDVVRPQIAYAPQSPWAGGSQVALAMLLEVHRPGREEVAFVPEGDVNPERADMRARVTFFNDDDPLSGPLEVSFVKDC